MTHDRQEFVSCSQRLLSGDSSSGRPDVRSALLGKAPRYSPDRAFDTLHVALDLKVDFKKREVSGTAATRLRAFRDGVREFSFDARDLKIAAASVDGRPARFTHKGGKLVVRAPKALASGDEAEVLVRYRVQDPKVGLHFVFPGPHNPKNPVQVWSQSQPEEARYWFPCHDDPREKATSEVRATVPRGFRAVSNGLLAEETHKGAWSTYHWKMDQPHSIYLICLSAGRFAELKDEWDGIPVTYYCEKGREKEAWAGFSKTVKAMAFFSEVTGVRYPYDKYAQVAVAEYPGGMENTTCTTQTDAILIDRRAALDSDLDLLVAHELAHQWFGDLVTCRDWSHAWLNEGFATYFEILFQEHDKGSDEAEHELAMNARSYFDEDAKRYRRPVVCAAYKDPWVLFDRHLYEKGAWVLHMLRRDLGPALFGKAIGHYLRRHRGGSVETHDLILAIEDVSGRNMKPFFDQWVYRGGFPSFRADYDWDAKARKASLRVLQTQDITEDQPAYRARVGVRFEGAGWTKDFTVDLSAKDQRFSWTLPGEPLDVQFDPEFGLLKKLSLRKPRRMWTRQLVKAKKAVLRQEAAWELSRWGSRETCALLERAVRRERFWGAAAEMVRALGHLRTEDAFQALKRLSADRRPKVRRAVVEALAGFRRPETGAIASRLAHRDPSVHVEAEAYRTMGSMKDPRHLPQLLKGVLRPGYRDIPSSGAVGGLAATRSPKALAALRKFSKPPHAFGTRVSAVRALGDYASESREVTAWICALLSDPDERVNLVAIATLGRLEDERALPALEKSRKSPNSRVRVYSEEAIARIKVGDQNSKATPKR